MRGSFMLCSCMPSYCMCRRSCLCLKQLGMESEMRSIWLLLAVLLLLAGTTSTPMTTNAWANPGSQAAP
jgi:hypothetical protein